MCVICVDHYNTEHNNIITHTHNTINTHTHTTHIHNKNTNKMKMPPQ